MLSFASSVRILIGIKPVDMRKRVDGLCQLAEAELGGDIYSGAVFVFLSRRRDKIKILTWDTGGFVALYKRLEAGQFKMPRVGTSDKVCRLEATQLTMLLRGIDLSRVRKPVLWSLHRAKENGST